MEVRAVSEFGSDGQVAKRSVTGRRQYHEEPCRAARASSGVDEASRNEFLGPCRSGRRQRNAALRCPPRVFAKGGQNQQTYHSLDLPTFASAGPRPHPSHAGDTWLGSVH